MVYTYVPLLAYMPSANFLGRCYLYHTNVTSPPLVGVSVEGNIMKFKTNLVLL